MRMGLLGASAVAMGISFVAAGCGSGAGDLCLDDSVCVGDTTAPPPVIQQALCQDVGVSHLGLGGVELTADREKAVPGADRERTKPFSALTTEYTRVLGDGNDPSSLASSGSTFGEPDPRWYQEPAPSAVSLFTAYRVAFEGCLKLTGALDDSGDAKYSVAPSADTAKVECQSWARKFWSRAASADEVQACVDVAMGISQQETFNGKTTDTPPARRWAYACASVLTSAGFLAY